MKKTFYLLTAAALPFVFSACSDDNDGPDATEVREYKAYNLISTNEPNSVPMISECPYFVNLNLSKNTMQIKTNRLVAGGGTYSFTSPDNSYATSANAGYQLIGYSAKNVGVEGEPVTFITDLTCILASRLNFSLTPIPGIIAIQESMPRIYMSYRLGDLYNVRTFSEDSYYNGITTTEFEYKGTPSSFQDNQGGYRVILDVDARKATVVLYNVKFAARAPYLTLVLENLKLEFNASGYKVSGNDIVAKMLEAGDLTSYEARPFTKFNFTTVGTDLTKAEIKYEVKDTKMGLVYKGSFSGSLI